MNHDNENMKSIQRIAEKRSMYIDRNKYYYRDLTKFLRYNIPNGKNVLEIGCGIGYILDSVKPSRGVGIDISPEMIKIAKNKYPNLEFLVMDAQNIELGEKFDFIIISDVLGYFEDVQKFLKSLARVCTPETRIIFTYHNFLWAPMLGLAEMLNLKMRQARLNWLNTNDLSNLLYLENYDVIKTGRRLLFPKYIPLLSNLLNRYIGQLPIINKLCLVNFVIARINPDLSDKKDFSVSVVIPARNEEGNIENAIKRMPKLGSHTEIIFVEGNSSDNTYKEIIRVYEKYKDQYDIKYAKQDGKGKGDAVRKGFALAQGEILMILDADLTVPPEDLSKFYQAISSGRGEYINGSRLIYPMEKEAMRFLNMLGNKFFSIMFSWLLGQRLKDTLCGTKVLSRKNYQSLIANRSYFGDFDPFGDFDLIFGSAKLNLKIVEVPIKYRAREYGDTNISRFTHGWLLLKMVVFAMNKIKFL
ncbi:MAG: glycosyltransferase [Parcubacteria group bacterium]